MLSQHFVCTLITFFISYTLYPVCSKVGGGSLVLRHSAKFWRYCELSGETQRRALLRRQREKIKIFEPTTQSVYRHTHAHTFVPLRRGWPQSTLVFQKKI